MIAQKPVCPYIDRADSTYIGATEIFGYPGDYRVVSIFVTHMYGSYPTVVGAVVRMADGRLNRLWYTWEGDDIEAALNGLDTPPQVMHRLGG